MPSLIGLFLCLFWFLNFDLITVFFLKSGCYGKKGKQIYNSAESFLKMLASNQGRNLKIHQKFTNEPT